MPDAGLEKLLEAANAEVQEERTEAIQLRPRSLWSRCAAFWALVAEQAKVAATIVVSIATIVGIFVRAWQVVRARDSATVLPQATGMATTAADYVDGAGAASHMNDGTKGRGDAQ